MQRKKANIAPRCFWGWLLRTWHEDFLSSFEKQQQKELFPASHTWRKSRHKTHTHATLVYYLTRVIGAAHFLLFPLLLSSAHFFFLPPQFQPEKNCLKWRHWFDHAGYFIIDETISCSPINWSWNSYGTGIRRMGRSRREIWWRGKTKNKKEFRNKVKGYYCLSYVCLKLFWWGLKLIIMMGVVLLVLCVQEETREDRDRLLCAVWRKKKTIFSEKTFFGFVFSQLFVTFSSCAGALIIIMRARINNKMEQQQQQPPLQKNNNMGASQYNAVFETNKRSSPKSLDRKIR